MKKLLPLLLILLLAGCGSSADTAADKTEQDQTAEKGMISATVLEEDSFDAEGQTEEVVLSDGMTPLSKTPSADAGKTPAEKITALVNEERIAAGLEPLILDASLTEAAQIRAEEIKKSFSHMRPDGSSCFDLLDQRDIKYYSAAENIAGKIKSPEKVVQAWMNSESHRTNILNGAYTAIGVGYTEGGYWTQLFTGQ